MPREGIGTSMSTSSSEITALVIGGCGFVGYHVVENFVKDPIFSAVTVISRSAAKSKYQIPGVQYLSVDITDHAAVQKVFDEIRPTVVVHAACPSPTTGTPKEYKSVTIDGTNTLLSIAKACQHTRAFIYTSSSTLAKGREHINITEDYPLANTDPSAPAYGRTKADAENTVCSSTNLPEKLSQVSDWTGYLRTGALRFPIVYGSHDSLTIPACLEALRAGQTGVQLGNGENMWDYCSAENAAVAHSLLAHGLLDTNSTGLDGQAFHINDGQSMPFWDFARAIWRKAGWKGDDKKIRKIPATLLLGIATLLEWMFYIFTLGRKRPGLMGMQQVEYSCFTHTYSIEKAKQRLNYVPKQNFDVALQEAVTWSLEHDGWAEKLSPKRG
jgi:sterol-4alpha-carboxylate 3-dehydrogenase (decarboxylating)